MTLKRSLMGMRRKVKTIEETAVKEEPAPVAPTAAAEGDCGTAAKAGD